MDNGATRRGGFLLRKTYEQVQIDVSTQTLRRTLGPLQLISLGVGCIIGAGIFVLTGNAAANFAGPAVLISFIFAGLACGCTALCYAELSSTMPVAGSAYTYSYASLGEGAAWLTGWLMLLEFGIAVALVAVGFSGYAVSLLADFGIHVPAWISTSWIDSVTTPSGTQLTFGNGINVVAALAVIAVMVILVFGVSLSAAVNSAIVAIKLTVLVAFVAIGVWWISPDNWVPFIPPNEGGFAYGWPGIFRASSIIFFAYLGFEAVSTAAAEARNPQRDIPIGIVGSLVVCTLLYMAVAAVLTGIVPFRQLAVPDPIALAVNAIGLPWFATFVKVGAIIGLLSVMLVTLYGQSRIFYAMSRDGLLPPAFAKVHPRYQTPHVGTLLVGVFIAIAAALMPINVLTDLVSLGTGLSFAIVCLTVMWLRTTHPELPRPFRVPLGGTRIAGVWVGPVPVIGIGFCLLMIVPLLLDILGKAGTGDPMPATLLVGYTVIGLFIYYAYGIRHSRLRHNMRRPARD
jgi:APA family basic amino acid/polyamine antiporter